MNSLLITAAAQASDAIVLAAVALGAVLGLTGIASFDPRVRARLPVAALARGNATVAVGLILAGVLVIGIALGMGE